jgi:hypothetical protein
VAGACGNRTHRSRRRRLHRGFEDRPDHQARSAPAPNLRERFETCRVSSLSTPDQAWECGMSMSLPIIARVHRLPSFTGYQTAVLAWIWHSHPGAPREPIVQCLGQAPFKSPIPFPGTPSIKDWKLLDDVKATLNSEGKPPIPEYIWDKQPVIRMLSQPDRWPAEEPNPDLESVRVQPVGARPSWQGAEIA